MVADRHRLAAYRNKHCWRAFQRYQHRWPWRTLNAQNRGFSECFAIFGYGVHWASEFSLKLLEIDKTPYVGNYTDAVARLMSISSDFLLHLINHLPRLSRVCSSAENILHVPLTSVIAAWSRWLYGVVAGGQLLSPPKKEISLLENFLPKKIWRSKFSTCRNFGIKLEFWAHVISSVGNLELSVGK